MFQNCDNQGPLISPCASIHMQHICSFKREGWAVSYYWWLIVILYTILLSFKDWKALLKSFMWTSFSWSGVHRRLCELTPWANTRTCPTHSLSFACLLQVCRAFIWSQRLDWTGELESNIEELRVGYQDHRHTFPKVNASVPRIHFINTLHFLRQKNRPPSWIL